MIVVSVQVHGNNDISITPKMQQTDLFVEHGPIAISSNEMFSNYNFIGDGSDKNPYRIESLNITSDNQNIPLIQISNVNVHFLIANNFLDGKGIASWGILIQGSTNGIIENNQVENIHNAIVFDHTVGMTVKHNYIKYCTFSISIEANSNYNVFINNTLIFSFDTGLWLGDASLNNSFFSNVFYSAFYTSIKIFTNIDRINQDTSIIGQFSEGNIFENNFISNSSKIDLTIDSFSNNNIFRYNDFLGGDSKVTDSGSGNNYTGNYFDGWTSGSPYYIDNGIADNNPAKSLLNDDFDNDGFDNEYEVKNGLDPFTDESITDSDGDGIPNLTEIQLGLSPNSPDSDNDKMEDGWEVKYGLDPKSDDSNFDKDGDWIRNIQEYYSGTNPNEFFNVPLFSFSFLHFIILIPIVVVLFTTTTVIIIKERDRQLNIIKQTNSPDYETALLVQDGNFKDYETYKKALDLNVTKFEDYELLLELKKLENE